MTDNEIIKALKELLEIMLCEGDLQRSATISKALDLINRQKAEVSDLQHRNAELDIELKAMRGAANSYKAENENLKEYIYRCKSGEEYWVKHLLERPNIAIIEFAERLKDTLEYGHFYISGDVKTIIDNLVKEMVGDDNG